jgi:hypothetical protein
VKQTEQATLNSRVRSIAATVAGLLTAFLLVMIVESVSVAIHPLPPDLDTSDPIQMAEFVRNVPLSGFLIVLTAWSFFSFWQKLPGFP